MDSGWLHDLWGLEPYTFSSCGLGYVPETTKRDQADEVVGESELECRWTLSQAGAKKAYVLAHDRLCGRYPASRHSPALPAPTGYRSATILPKTLFLAAAARGFESIYQRAQD